MGKMLWFCRECQDKMYSDILWHTKRNEWDYIRFYTICGCGATTMQFMPPKEWEDLCSRYGKYLYPKICLAEKRLGEEHRFHTSTVVRPCKDCQRNVVQEFYVVVDENSTHTETTCKVCHFTEQIREERRN